MLCRGQESWQGHPPLVTSPPETYLHQQPENGNSTEEGGLQDP